MAAADDSRSLSPPERRFYALFPCTLTQRCPCTGKRLIQIATGNDEVGGTSFPTSNNMLKKGEESWLDFFHQNLW